MMQPVGCIPIARQGIVSVIYLVLSIPNLQASDCLRFPLFFPKGRGTQPGLYWPGVIRKRRACSFKTCALRAVEGGQGVPVWF